MRFLEIFANKPYKGFIHIENKNKIKISKKNCHSNDELALAIALQ